MTTTPPDIPGLVAALTDQEKVALMTGADFWTTVPVDRLGIPAVRMSDGPNGARGAGGLTNGSFAAAFPCELVIGATWDPEAAYEMGCALAAETRDRGARILLAPTVNIHRSGLSGRNFECYSEDPFLTAKLAVACIRGLQDNGVAATIKHLIGNDSEYRRETASSDIDERTLREIYLPPFEAAVKQAGVWAVMTGYNRLNGEHCDGHEELLSGIMRGEFGYDGIFMSDWSGMNSTVAAARAGNDLEMPGPTRHRGDKLLAAIAAGEVPAQVLDEAATRLLTLFQRVGAFDSAGPEPETSNDRDSDRALIRRLGADGAVLLKNAGDILPLAPTGKIAAIGPNAAEARIMGGGSAQIRAHRKVSPLDGLVAALGADRVSHAQGCDNARMVPVMTGDFTVTFHEGRARAGAPVCTQPAEMLDFYWFDMPDARLDKYDFSAVIEGSFTATRSGEHVFGMANGGLARLYIDSEEVIDGETGWTRGMNFFGYGNDERRATRVLEAGRSYHVRIDYACIPKPPEGVTARAIHVGVCVPTGAEEIAEAVRVASESEVALLFVGRQGEWDGEGYDLPDMRLPGAQDALISAVAAANPRTIVVLQTGGPVEMPWLDQVAAVIQFSYAGQEVGHAIADVLLGRAAPGGRLPQTWPVAMKDNSGWSDDPLTYPGLDDHVFYHEGIFVGYRGFDRMGIAPLFPFGHGLGYSRVDWGQAELSSDHLAGDGDLTVALSLHNTGAHPAAEVVQLYVAPGDGPGDGPLPRAPKSLKAFRKCRMAPGADGQVSLTITPRDLAAFAPENRLWTAPAGRYRLLIGASAGDIRQEVAITLIEDWNASPEAF